MAVRGNDARSGSTPHWPLGQAMLGKAARVVFPCSRRLHRKIRSASDDMTIREKDSRVVEEPYRSLDLTNLPNHIRILRLHPLPDNQDDETPISCTVEVVSLDEKPAYQALSYAWGSRQHDETDEALRYQRGPRNHDEKITASGVSMSMTANLAGALRGLRQRNGEERKLWIDAICIDQANTDERSQQVSLMGEIYRRASHVLIWLGEIKGDKYATPGFLGDDLGDGDVLIRPREEYGEDYATAGSHVGDRNHWYWQNKLSRDQALNSHCADLARAIRFTTPKHWTRAWVLQETVINIRPPIFCFGHHQMTEALLNATLSCNFAENPDINYYPQLTELLGFLQTTQTIRNDIRRLRYEYDLGSIRKVLANASYPEASDPRDMVRVTRNSFLYIYADNADIPCLKVYSLLGIIRPSEASSIQVDYQQPWIEVYARTTWAMMQACGTMEPLCSVNLQHVPHHSFTLEHLPDLKSEPQLPSWAIDFRTKSRHTALPGDSVSGNFVRTEIDCSMTLSDDARVLLCYGYEVTHIHAKTWIYPTVLNWWEENIECMTIDSEDPIVDNVVDALEELEKLSDESMHPRSREMIRFLHPSSGPQDQRVEDFRHSYEDSASYSHDDQVGLYIGEDGHMGFCREVVEPGDIVAELGRQGSFTYATILKPVGEQFIFRGFANRRHFPPSAFDHSTPSSGRPSSAERVFELV